MLLDKELSELEKESAELTEQWQSDKDALANTTKIKEELDHARSAVERAIREGKLEEAGELQYSLIPALEEKVEHADRQEGSHMLEEMVISEHIASVVSKWTGIPVDKVLEGEREKLLNMEANLKHRVIGQDDALSSVANAVRRARAGLQDVSRPIGSFLFLGPTGVGKTELTKALAEFLFDDEQAMVRIDMSEYMEKHSVSRLIGAPPGYVGYDEGGMLTEAVRRRPYQVILLDEVEKAHPDIFNVLLQVLDDGRLTDGQGRTVDFRNTIIILTSNLGAEILAEQEPDNDTSEIYEKVMSLVRSSFRPEFLNRLDETILFHRLFPRHMNAIVEIELNRLQKLLEYHSIILNCDNKAIEWLASAGYDVIYGARPLKRVIQNHLQNPMSSKILEGSLKNGHTARISVEANDILIDCRKVENH